MAKRVCSEPGCGTIVAKAGRCGPCRGKFERRRGSRHVRGYGSGHVAERRKWEPIVAAGGVLCARCGIEISPHAAWDLGHDDFDRTNYTGPEHLKCNRGARPDRLRGTSV